MFPLLSMCVPTIEGATGSTCVFSWLQLTFMLIGSLLLGFGLLFISSWREQKKEDNIKHWKQVGVNKPRRDFEG